MGQFTVKIDTDNAAFEDMTAEAVALLLRGLADRVENNGLHQNSTFPLRDYNENKVGEAVYEDD